MKQTFNFGTENTENYELQRYNIDPDFIEDFFFLRCVKGNNMYTSFVGYYTFEKEEGYDEPLLVCQEEGGCTWSYQFIGLNYIWIQEFEEYFIKQLKEACADYDNLTVVIRYEDLRDATMKPLVYLDFYTRVSK